MTTNKTEIKIYEPSEKGATTVRKVSFRNTGPAIIDTCDHGHKFAKLDDHPGNSCVHCLRVGLASARAEVERLSAVHDKLIFVGYTNGFQILYANDSSHGGEGLFFKDTDIDCTIPLYMLRTHYHRLETTSFGEVTLERLRKVQQPITEGQGHEK